MKAVFSLYLSTLMFLGAAEAQASDSLTYQQVGVATEAPSGLTVTVNDVTILPKSGSTQLVLSYSLKNNSPDQKLEEGKKGYSVTFHPSSEGGLSSAVP
jgi:hypothetical protein